MLGFIAASQSDKFEIYNDRALVVNMIITLSVKQERLSFLMMFLFFFFGFVLLHTVVKTEFNTRHHKFG
jgi:hypothetical protein